MVVELTESTEQATSPVRTTAPDWMPTPVKVSKVPPAVAPLLGETLSMLSGVSPSLPDSCPESKQPLSRKTPPKARNVSFNRIRTQANRASPRSARTSPLRTVLARSG